MRNKTCHKTPTKLLPKRHECSQNPLTREGKIRTEKPRLKGGSRRGSLGQSFFFFLSLSSSISGLAWYVGWRPEGPLVECKEGAREVECRNQSCCERSGGEGRRKKKESQRVHSWGELLTFPMLSPLLVNVRVLCCLTLLSSVLVLRFFQSLRAWGEGVSSSICFLIDAVKHAVLWLRKCRKGISLAIDTSFCCCLRIGRSE